MNFKVSRKSVLIIFSLIVTGLVFYLLQSKLFPGRQAREIKDLFAEDSKIIEIQSLEFQGYPNRALVVWMVNPTGYSKEDDFYTCPEVTRGSYNSGPTRVSLVDTKRIELLNTTEIINVWGKDTFDLTYRIRKDLWDGYHFISTTDKKEITPKIIWLRDYNGDGKELEFALFDAVACMGFPTTLIGYSQIQDKVIVYPIKNQDNEISYWFDYLFVKEPKARGEWEYEIDYAGRGGCLEKHLVSFNKEQEIFEAQTTLDNCYQPF